MSGKEVGGVATLRKTLKLAVCWCHRFASPLLVPLQAIRSEQHLDESNFPANDHCSHLALLYLLRVLTGHGFESHVAYKLCYFIILQVALYKSTK